MWMRSSTNHSLVSSSALPMPPRIAEAGTRTSVRTNCGWRSAKVCMYAGSWVRVTPGRVVVDEEQGCQALLAVDDVAVEDHEIGVGRAGHEPFLAIEDVVARRTVAHGGRFERASIRPGAGLGDGVAAVALAAETRLEVAAVAGRDRNGRGRCSHLGSGPRGRPSPGRAVRGPGPARAGSSPGRRPPSGSCRRGGRASMAFALTSRATSASRRPPAVSNPTSSGWRTSRANRRARSWSASWSGLSVRSIADRMGHAVGRLRRDVLGRGTPGKEEGRSVTGPRVVSLGVTSTARTSQNRCLASAAAAFAAFGSADVPGVKAPLSPRLVEGGCL